MPAIALLGALHWTGPLAACSLQRQGAAGQLTPGGSFRGRARCPITGEHDWGGRWRAHTCKFSTVLLREKNTVVPLKENGLEKPAGHIQNSCLLDVARTPISHLAALGT